MEENGPFYLFFNVQDNGKQAIHYWLYVLCDLSTDLRDWSQITGRGGGYKTGGGGATKREGGGGYKTGGGGGT